MLQITSLMFLRMVQWAEQNIPISVIKGSVKHRAQNRPGLRAISPNFSQNSPGE